jgi:sterol 3beta-glucosyltransferase
MHMTVVASGTRGDVQPILALSQGLREAGHEVVIVAGSNFETWIRGHGFGFVPTIDMEALMGSEKGLAWSENGHNPMKQLRLMRELLAEHGEELVLPLVQSAAATDLLISGFTSEPFVQSIGEKTGVPHLNAILQPQLPSRYGPVLMAPVRPQTTSIFNGWMAALAERLIWSVSANATNNLRTRHLGLPPMDARGFWRGRMSTPRVMGFSRHIVPPAPDWPQESVVTGYWFLDEPTEWQPSPELSNFLEAGEPPVYIGFGSMSHRDPQATLDLIRAAVQQTRQRAIVGLGWSKGQQANLPTNLFVLQNAPHHWLFPRMAAVVHHGGAGTTAAGLRAGRPTLIIPHMADQPYWGRRVHELGVGVKPVPRHKLTAKVLAEGLNQLVCDTQIKVQAEALGVKIRAEQGVEVAVQAIEELMRRG